jgi:transcriptional regulator with XRE-family HTH domain
MRNLHDFLLHEMRSRGMSARQFAEFVGVANTTITRAMYGDEAPMPGLEFLAKLASATGTDLCALVALVMPEAVRSVSPEESLLAARISRLPRDKQEIVDSFVLGALLKQSDEKS